MPWALTLSACALKPEVAVRHDLGISRSRTRMSLACRSNLKVVLDPVSQALRDGLAPRQSSLDTCFCTFAVFALRNPAKLCPATRINHRHAPSHSLADETVRVNSARTLRGQTICNLFRLILSSALGYSPSFKLCLNRSFKKTRPPCLLPRELCIVRDRAT